MNSVYQNLLKRKAISEIKRLGNGICELIIEIELSSGICNSLEFDEYENKIYVHRFKQDFDETLDFESLEEKDKLKIIESLKAI